jgi:hypothetical protein
MELSWVAALLARAEESEDSALCARGPQASTTAPVQRSQMDSRDEITIRFARGAGRRGRSGVARCENLESGRRTVKRYVTS